MALTDSDSKALRLSADGSPWCRVPAKAGIITTDSHLSVDGSPWYAAVIASAAQYAMYVGATRITTMYVGATEVTTGYVGTTILK